MSELRITKKKITGRRIGAPSKFPAIDHPLKRLSYVATDEAGGLFLNYGRIRDTLPYTFQDDFDHSM